MSSPPIRVVVVDDSVVVRGLLAKSVELDPALQLVGTAMHGEAALSLLKRSPADVVVLDVEMPVLDGIATLQRIQAEHPQTRVIMASALTQEGADVTCRALSLGAAGCIAKPVSSSISGSMDQLARELLPLIHAVGGARRSSSHTPLSTAPPSNLAARRRSPATPDFQAIAIGTSTGGPQALKSLLSSLPSDFPLPIFIVQHMPPMFTPMLAKHLASDTRRPCREAVDMETIEPGRMYVAPGDFHLELERSEQKVRVRLNQNPQENFFRPSVNPLFRSAARCYGPQLLAVMLTGMGDDGCAGTRAVVDLGGHVIAQDEATSVVWGMPGAVVRAGLAHEVLPLDQIGPRILKFCLAEVAR